MDSKKFACAGHLSSHRLSRQGFLHWWTAHFCHFLVLCACFPFCSWLSSFTDHCVEKSSLPTFGVSFCRTPDSWNTCYLVLFLSFSSLTASFCCLFLLLCVTCGSKHTVQQFKWCNIQCVLVLMVSTSGLGFQGFVGENRLSLQGCDCSRFLLPSCILCKDSLASIPRIAVVSLCCAMSASLACLIFLKLWMPLCTYHLKEEKRKSHFVKEHYKWPFWDKT